MNTRSLSFRLVTWYAGLLTLVFVLLGALTIVLLRQYLEANVLDTQERRARQIGISAPARNPARNPARLIPAIDSGAAVRMRARYCTNLGGNP